MIAAALVLVVAGAVALVVGLVSGDALVWGYVTIGCCLLAGALLVAGVRRSRPQREPVVQSGGHGHGAAWGGASDRTGGPAGDRDERLGAEVHAGGRSAGDDAATARAFGGDDGLAWAPTPAEDDEPPAASADVGDPDDPLRPVDGGMQPPVVAVAVDPGAVPDAPPVPAEPAAAGPAAAGPAADQATGAAQSPPADGSPRLF